jgi:hypothetical protein
MAGMDETVGDYSETTSSGRDRAFCGYNPLRHVLGFIITVLL